MKLNCMAAGLALSSACSAYTTRTVSSEWPARSSVVRTLWIHDASMYTSPAYEERLPGKDPANGKERCGNIGESRRTVWAFDC